MIYINVSEGLLYRFRDLFSENKINNEIITSVDLQNEINYLIALNPNLKNLEYQI